MALIDCLHKSSLTPHEKKFIVKRAAELHQGGLDQTAAELQAVKEMQHETLSSMEDIHKQLNEKANQATQPAGPQATGTTPPGGTGNEPIAQSNQGKTKPKTLLNRAHEGVTEEDVKKSIEKHGLKYQVESHLQAEESAENFIADVGIENALDAVRQNAIEDGAAAFVWSKIIDEVGNRISKTTDPNEIQELTNIETQLISEFDQKARSGGRFISALQEVYRNSDFHYSVEAQTDKFKKANDGVLPADIEAKFKELDAKIKSANKRIRELESQKTASFGQFQEAERKARRKLITSEKRKEINDFFDKLKIDLPKGMATASILPVPQILNAAIDIIKTAVLAGADVANAIQAGIDYIKSKQKDFDEAKFREFLTPVISKIVPKAKIDKVPTPEMKEGKLYIPSKLIKDIVSQGVDTLDALVEAVHSIVSETIPNISLRQVRDAITQYGKTSTLSKDDIDVQIRKLKRAGRLISALEDVQKKMRPLRSGLQRDKLSDEERKMQRDLREAMKELPVDDEEEAKTWRTALDAVKSRLGNQIVDLERQIETGEKTPEKKGIEYDEEAKVLKKRRDDLKEILQAIEGKQELSDEQKVKLAIKAVERSLADYDRRIKEKDFSKPEKRTVPETAELKALREARDQAKKTYDDLKESEGVAEKERLEKAKKNIRKSIGEYERRITEGDFSKRQPKEIIADSELLQLQAQKIAAKEEYDRIQYQNELKNRSKTQKVIDGVVEAWGLTRALRATGEFSFILLQGGVQSLAHPTHAAKAFVTALNHFASESRQKEWFSKIRAQEWYGRAKESKLAITETDHKLTAREEMFLGGWVNHIWDVAGLPIKLVSSKAFETWKKFNPVKAVERAGTGYLNTLRVMRYLDGEQMLSMDGKPYRNNEADYKNMADVINTFTGRASLGPAERIAKELSIVFFSPRNWASVIKQATPYAFYHFGKMGSKGDPWYKPSVAQKMAMGDYMKYVALTGSIVALTAGLAGGDDDDKDKWTIELDPTSSDFLKLKHGNTRVDPWGGRIQMITLQARLILGAMKKGSDRIELGVPHKTPTRLELMLKMAENKLAPSASILEKQLNSHYKTIDGKRVKVDQYGNPLAFDEQVYDNLYPIYWETIKELHQDQPATIAAFLDFLAFLGIGTNTYPDAPPKVEKEKTLRQTINESLKEPLRGVHEMDSTIRKITK